MTISTEPPDRLDVEANETAIRVAVDGLVERYGHHLTVLEIDATVRRCFEECADARIRDFVPVLAERAARHEIAERMRVTPIDLRR